MKLSNVLVPVLLSAAFAVVAAEPGKDAQSGKGVASAVAGGYHLELMVKDKTLELYVDGKDGKAADASGFKAQANVFSGTDKGTVELKPAGRNLLKGEASFALRPDAKFVVTLTPPGGEKAVQARFALGGKDDHKGHKH